MPVYYNLKHRLSCTFWQSDLTKICECYMLLYLTERNSESSELTYSHYLYQSSLIGVPTGFSTTPLHQRLWTSSSVTALAEHNPDATNRKEQRRRNRLRTEMCVKCYRNHSQNDKVVPGSQGRVGIHGVIGLQSVHHLASSHPHRLDTGDIEFVKLHYVT